MKLLHDTLESKGFNSVFDSSVGANISVKVNDIVKQFKSLDVSTLFSGMMRENQV